MWKNMLIGISAFVLLASSCGNQPKQVSQKPMFQTETNLEAHILTDTALIAYPYDICVDDSYLYVLSLVEDNWVQVYDKNSGAYAPILWVDAEYFWEQTQNPQSSEAIGWTMAVEKLYNVNSASAADEQSAPRLVTGALMNDI